MKNSKNLTSELYCSVFGHNYIRINSSKLVCKSCCENFHEDLDYDLSGTPSNSKEMDLMRDLLYKTLKPHSVLS